MPYEVIDISPALRDPMPIYPNNPLFSIRTVRSVKDGERSTLSEITLGTHTGTHVDAPSHFIADAHPLEGMGLEPLVGTARVIAIDVAEQIEQADLEPHVITRGERLLIKTRNSALWAKDEFDSGYVYLSVEAARYLAGLGIACLGVDYLSVGGGGNGVEVHQAFLGEGILLIEGLDLSAAEPGEYDLVCLPLKLSGAEAAPARAVLRRLI